MGMNIFIIVLFALLASIIAEGIVDSIEEAKPAGEKSCQELAYPYGEYRVKDGWCQVRQRRTWYVIKQMQEQKHETPRD